MGGINFAWLAVRDLSPDYLRRLGEAAAPGERDGT